MTQMRFAHWTNIVANRAIAGPSGIPLQRDHSLEMDATLFIVDIPVGMTRQEVIKKLMDVRGVCIEETDGLGFQEEWPREIRRQFDSLDADSDMIRSWASMQ